MGKSFVLKDRMGQTVGYLASGLCGVRCRMDGTKDDMRAVLFHKDGTKSEYALDASLTEQQWKDEAGVLVGAVIVLDGVIAAETGADARAYYAKCSAAKEHAARQKNRKKPDRCPMKEEKKQAESARDTAKEREERTEMPQRRWPRPPCWQAAVYQKGKWTEKKA